MDEDGIKELLDYDSLEIDLWVVEARESGEKKTYETPLPPTPTPHPKKIHWEGFSRKFGDLNKLV